MKNYPHLYPNSALNKKVLPKNNKSPSKVTPIMGVTFTPKSSQKNIVTYNSQLNRNKKLNERNLTRSIEDTYISGSQGQIQFKPFKFSKLQNCDDELFSQSYNKIGMIRQNFSNKNIDHQLNDILNLIKEEKSKINEKMQALKKSNDYYRTLYQNKLEKTFVEEGINTEQIIKSHQQTITFDQSIQTQDPQQLFKQKTEQKVKKENNEIVEASGKGLQLYIKLSTMLEDMNINPKDVLPEGTIIDFKVKDFKQLSDSEIIKIQKFFIKKLVQKISK